MGTCLITCSEVIQSCVDITSLQCNCDTLISFRFKVESVKCKISNFKFFVDIKIENEHVKKSVVFTHIHFYWNAIDKINKATIPVKAVITGVCYEIIITVENHIAHFGPVK